MYTKWTVYTLKPLNVAYQPTWKWSTTHKERIWKTFEAYENSSSRTKYIVTSVHVWKNHKKDNQNHICILVHREALSVIRCVLLQEYSYWYLLQSGEKRSTLSSNGNPFMYCRFVTLNMVQEVYATGLKKPLFQDGLKWGITKAYWGSV